MNVMRNDYIEADEKSWFCSKTDAFDLHLLILL